MTTVCDVYSLLCSGFHASQFEFVYGVLYSISSKRVLVFHRYHVPTDRSA